MSILKNLINIVKTVIFKIIYIGDWDWGLGIGPQSPIPNPQSPMLKYYCMIFYYILNIFNFV